MRSSSSAEHRLLPLAAAEATEPTVAGAKAAALARAHQAGLPVLPGLVVPAAAAEPAVRAAVTASRAATAGPETTAGPAATARRAALAQPVSAALAAALATAVRGLGGQVIVRSSSPLESDHRWSGAFSSIREVGPADAAVAVRSCWASAFAPDPLARAAAAGLPLDQLGLAALLQPQLSPTSGGVARVTGQAVHVTAVAGHPGALLSGWVTGQTTVVERETDPDPRISAVAILARQVADTLGYDLVEWAATGGEAGAEIHLLQAAHAPAPTPRPVALPPALAATGRRVSGNQSVPGDALGRLRFVRPHQAPSGAGPHILVCERPVPALAPLLFGARGLVSLSGPAECHLVEVARALGVPCLVDTPVARLTGPPDLINAGEWLAAIDGARNELVVLPAGAGARHEGLPHTFRRITSALAAGR